MDKRFILAHGFNLWLADSTGFRPVVRQKSHGRGVWGRKIAPFMVDRKHGGEQLEGTVDTISDIPFKDMFTMTCFFPMRFILQSFPAAVPKPIKL